MGVVIGSGKGPKSEINVTPLVDVCLVLLIIFMVVTPLMQKNKDVVLPQAQNISERAKEEDPLTISITHDEHVWIGASPVRLEDVKKAVERTMAETPDKAVLIKGDERLTMKRVREVMKEVQEAGAKSVGLGVDKPDEP